MVYLKKKIKVDNTEKSAKYAKSEKKFLGNLLTKKDW